MMLSSDLRLKLTSDYEVVNLAISYWCCIYSASYGIINSMAAHKPANRWSDQSQ